MQGKLTTSMIIKKSFSNIILLLLLWFNQNGALETVLIEIQPAHNKPNGAADANPSL